MSCFVRPTVQNLKIFSLQWYKMRKAANPHLGEATTTERLAFLLKKWLQWSINHQNTISYWLHFSWFMDEDLKHEL